jgi:hypothetical protein
MSTTRPTEPAAPKLNGTDKRKPNIVDMSAHREAETPPPMSELGAALNLPNIDDRASVLANLPKELYVEGRVSFEEEEEDSVPGVRFGTPRQADYVRCDLSRSTVDWDTS